jgi:hypothetical protein
MYYLYSPTVAKPYFLLPDGRAKIVLNQSTVLLIISTRSPLNARSLQSPVAFARIRWVETAAANMLHSRMRPQKRQVAVLCRAQTKSRAEHIGVCAVASGIHRSFRSAIRLRTEGAWSAGVNTRS